MCLPIVKNQTKDLSDIWLLAWYFLGLKLHLFFNKSIYNSSDMWTQRHVGPLVLNSTYIKNNNTYALIYHSFFIYLIFVFCFYSFFFNLFFLSLLLLLLLLLFSLVFLVVFCMHSPAATFFFNLVFFILKLFFCLFLCWFKLVSKYFKYLH